MPSFTLLLRLQFQIQFRNQQIIQPKEELPTHNKTWRMLLLAVAVIVAGLSWLLWQYRYCCHQRPIRSFFFSKFRRRIDESWLCNFNVKGWCGAIDVSLLERAFLYDQNHHCTFDLKGWCKGIDQNSRTQFRDRPLREIQSDTNFYFWFTYWRHIQMTEKWL